MMLDLAPLITSTEAINMLKILVMNEKLNKNEIHTNYNYSRAFE